MGSDVSNIAVTKVKETQRTTSANGHRLSDGLKAAASKVVGSVFSGWFKSSADANASLENASADTKDYVEVKAHNQSTTSDNDVEEKKQDEEENKSQTEDE